MEFRKKEEENDEDLATFDRSDRFPTTQPLSRQSVWKLDLQGLLPPNFVEVNSRTFFSSLKSQLILKAFHSFLSKAGKNPLITLR